MSVFWKKRVPAFLMALVMIASLAPAALAVSETNQPCSCASPVIANIGGTGWRDDGTYHWQVCSNCGGQVNKSVHTPGSQWYRRDDLQHETRCSVCSRSYQTENHDWSTTTQNATCYQDGKIISRCRICDAEKEEIIPKTNQHIAANTWQADGDYHYHPCLTSGCDYKELSRQSHTFGGTYYTSSANPTKHWQQCTTCGAASAMSDHYDGNGDRRCDLCNADTTVTCRVNFETNGGTTIASQTVSAGGRPSNPGNPVKSGCTFKGWSLSNTSVYNGQTLYTSEQVASTNITSTNTTYYAVYAVSATGRNISIDGGTSTGGTNVGSSLYSQLNTQLRNYISGLSVATVTFSNVSSSTYGTLYTGSNQRTSVTSSTSYTDSEVSGFYFVPGSYTGYTINYTAKDSGGYNSVSGTITINGSASTSALISYTAAPGGSVSFRASDFQRVFRDHYSTGTVEYVVFTPDNNYTNFYGSIYSGSVSLSRNSLANNTFYYSNSYSQGYSLDSLTFRADSGARNGDVLRIPFRAYRNSSYYVDGTVELRISGSTSANNNRTISYRVTAGQQLTFSVRDFANLFNREYPDYDLSYVVFDRPDTYAFSEGVLYSNYGSSRDQVAFTRNNLNSYRFYYSSYRDGDYALNSLSFVADRNFRTDVNLTFTAYDTNARHSVTGTVQLSTGSNSSNTNTRGDLTYTVSASNSVKLRASDFSQFLRRELGSAYTLSYVVFERPDANAFSNGTLYYNYGGRNQVSFTQANLASYDFYYNSTSSNRYDLDDLTFLAGRNFRDNVSLPFTAYSTAGNRLSGTVLISAGNGGTATAVSKVSYSVRPGETLRLKPADFQAAYRSVYASGDIAYVTFTPPAAYDAAGMFYYNYGGARQVSFTRAALERTSSTFYYSNSQDGEYPLDDLTFAAFTTFAGTLSIPFRAYYSTSLYVDGTMEIKADTSAINNPNIPGGTVFSGDIRYAAVANNNVQINANDIARFFTKNCPGSTLQYVTLNGVPATGGLYYNYYGASKYGAATRTAFTVSNYNSQALYFSPTSAAQYALTELTYVPSGYNYCATIPFTAYGSASRSVSGNILISVTSKAVSDVYGVTNKSSAVTLPMSSISSVVSSASGVTPVGIRILTLPAAAAGVLYTGTGTTRADTTTLYSLSTHTLRFVPSGSYTGSVEIPYVAYNANNVAIGSGKVCIGVVNSIKSFKDVTNTTWCYKYVVELSDANVIDGYSDNTFKPDNIITYGAALKLIMLAAGYPEQAPTTAGSPFSGYLTKARADGIITRSNVNLRGSITRQQVAQLAAGSMKLDTSNLSSVQPFTDTSDASVRALNAAGIVEGYFNNGTSTFRPGNTLTRGQVSAIVWRMRNYNK